MSNKLTKKPEESDVLKIIQEGKFFREDGGRVYNFTGDVADACIDSSRFADPQGLRLSISDDVLDVLDSKNNALDKFKIAERDKTNVLLAYLASYHQYSSNEISSFIKSEDNYLASVGAGLAVTYDLPQIIPASNNESLYKYFRSHKISKESLSLFFSDSFIQYSFSKMREEERVIFTWMVNNLTSLVGVDAINVGKNADFFVKLLRENDYPNETHKALYILALEKNPDFINQVVKIRLGIDPFTKQTNFTKWLKEVRMFNFISDLRDSLPEKYTSDGVSVFDKVKVDLYKINKGDSSLLM